MSDRPGAARYSLMEMSARGAFDTLFVCLLLGACTRPQELSSTSSAIETYEHCDQVSGLCFQVALPQSHDAACPPEVMVGRLGNLSQCPTPATSAAGSWRAEKVFAVPADGSQVPAKLDEFCTYRWETESAHPPDPSALPTDGTRQDWLAPDCHVIGAHAGGHPFMDLAWPSLESAFLAQVERLPTAAVNPAAAPVRVEIIDSAVTRRDGKVSKGRFAHGRAMGLIVQRLTCGTGAGCSVNLASTLALPMLATSSGVIRDYAEGGYFGSQTDVARAIYDAVYAWEADAPDHKLILNLSIGWDPRFNEETAGAGLSPPTLSVYEAIKMARCRGALVIAAAGNEGGGPTPGSGPLYPGAWELEAAPQNASCVGLLRPELHPAEAEQSAQPANAVQPTHHAGPAIPAIPTQPGEDEPLVYSAAGVEGRDRPLDSTRLAGRPRLAAPAAHAIVADGVQGDHSEAYTGSSVAAAVTSAAAAMVWTHRPELSPAAVMNLVYNAAVDLGVQADYCLDPPCPSVRRVSVCRAVAAACAMGGPRCPLMPLRCPNGAAYRDLRPLPIDLTPLAINEVVSRDGPHVAYELGWPCNAQLFTSSPPTDDPCPARQYWGTAATPWVLSQPASPPCTKCLLEPLAGQLLIAIDPEFPEPLTHPVLTVVETPDRIYVFDLSEEIHILQPGETVLVTDLALGIPEFQTASLEFIIPGPESVFDEVLMWRQ